MSHARNGGLIRCAVAAVGLAGALTVGCTTAEEPDAGALGDLDPDTCLPTDPPDEPPGALSGLSNDDEDVVNEIATQVAAIRELGWGEVPTPVFLDAPRLAEVIAAARPADLLDVERRLLASIGAIPPEFDLPGELAAFETAFAGHYLWDQRQVLLRQETPGQLRPAERTVLAHELLHALSDQTIGLPTDVLVGADGDAALASLAVVEGEATVLESFWTSLHLTGEDRDEMVLTYDEIGAERDLPHVVRRRAAFPYVEGRAFVCRVHRDGGWAAVDALYEEVPTTTAEILTGTPVELGPPPAVDDPGDDWVAIGRATVGAAELMWLFEAPGDDRGAALDSPLDRALAWRGGEVTVWTDTSTGAQDLVALTLVDGGEGAAPLCDSIDAWQTASFPDAERVEQPERFTYDRGDAHVVLRCVDDDVLLVVAPDPELAREMTEPAG